MTYIPKNYNRDGGDTSVIGGELHMEPGAKMTADGTQAAHIADLKINYTTGELDNEAKTIAAINATNTAINAILAALEGVGITATS